MTIPMASNSKIQHQNDDHTSAAHHWKLEFYERCILKGTCRCGAVRFYPDVYTNDYLERSKELNKTNGKEGDPNYHNEIKKEEIKTVKQEITLPPIPPKPEVKGNNKMALHKYYMENKDTIIAYINELGEAEACARWGISESGWRTVRAHLLPDKYQLPDWAKPKITDKPKRKYHKKEKLVIDTPSRAEIECEEIASARDMQLLADEERPIGEEIFGENQQPPMSEAEELYRQGLPTNRKFTGLQLDEKPEIHLLDLPAFPAFNDDWPEKVQCTWLLVYQELAECQKEKVASV